MGISRGGGLQYGSGVTGDSNEVSTASRESAQQRGGNDVDGKSKRRKGAAAAAIDIQSVFEKADAATKAALQARIKLARNGVDLTSAWGKTVSFMHQFAARMGKDPEMELYF